MSKLVPFKTLFGRMQKIQSLSETSVVVDGKGVPLGFVFGRDSFIAFLEHLDTEFEKRASDPRKAYDNPAGRLIDLIEDKLPLRKEYVDNLRKSLRETKKTDWIPFADIKRMLHV